MGGKGKAIVADAKEAAQIQMDDYAAQTKTAKAAVEKQKQAYKDIELKNPYADMENPYAENVFEDLTVNQQQAQFQAQQGAQQRANIMEGLRGAAGSSGIAGLAQAMAGQGQLQSQQISASIGQQEAMNQKLRAQGAQQVQAGAAAVDLQQRQGEAMLQQAVTGREATLLGMEYGELQGAQAGVQAAYANQQSAIAMDMERRGQNMAMTGQIIGGVASGAGALAGGIIAGSDKDLKKNVKKVGKSNDGINIYEFEYRNPKKWGAGKYQGVMAEDLPKGVYKKAVSKNKDNIEIVDYSKLDVEFKKV